MLPYMDPDATPSIDGTMIAPGRVIDSMTADSSSSIESSILLLEFGPHLVALFGIVALALLGGGLMIRNRVDRSGPSDRDESTVRTEEFMTDRERIQYLVRSNGGRMKQSEIVDSVDWSKAKVSRLLADLEDEEEITKLRLGRENLICLRGEEPAASKSSDGPGDD